MVGVNNSGLTEFFQIAILADDISVGGPNYPGKTSSCTPDGWPSFGVARFDIIVPTQLNPVRDPFPPATNAGIVVRRVGGFTNWMGMNEIVAGLFFGAIVIRLAM